MGPYGPKPVPNDVAPGMGGIGGGNMMGTKPQMPKVRKPMGFGNAY
jgi:hypothetical protein